MIQYIRLHECPITMCQLLSREQGGDVGGITRNTSRLHGVVNNGNPCVVVLYVYRFVRGEIRDVEKRLPPVVSSSDAFLFS